ncbi:MAG TPA: ABC transporter substrate-binding protein [Gaiellaceae bacterium]|nr:ABC transporter substrate-binding protein [Gaiellaceae bacterium]
MRKKMLLSAGMVAVGAAMLAVAVVVGPAVGGTAKSAASAAKGGTVNVANSTADFDNLDPAIAYVQNDWAVEYVTALKLMYYPDKGGAQGSNLAPDAATGFPVVSKDGKTYTFTIKNGLRFSDGTRVTAANFKAAFDRDADPTMNSPVVAFLTDVVGLNNEVNKKAKSVSGVVAKGMKLTIHLTHPDGGLLNKLAMPFLQAIKTNMAHDSNGIESYPSAGPYYIASRTVNRQTVLKRNPFYKGPRPHNSSAIVITVGGDQQQVFLQVRNGTYAYDMGAGPPPAAFAELAKSYGVNKSRLWVFPGLITNYLALNVARPAMANASARKSVNYAIDRPALVRILGYLGGKRATQLLPPALAGGFTNKNLYPIRGADFKTAKKLNPHCGSINLWSTTSTGGKAVGQIAAFDLSQIGCKVTVKSFQGGAIYTAAGTKGADFDVMRAGWVDDYPDPYDFYHLLLDGTTIVATNNTNFSYFNSKSVNKAIASDNLLTGQARLKAFGKLDQQVMTKYAPIASWSYQNSRDFISGNVAGYTFAPSVGLADLATFYNK